MAELLEELAISSFLYVPLLVIIFLVSLPVDKQISSTLQKTRLSQESQRGNKCLEPPARGPVLEKYPGPLFLSFEQDFSLPMLVPFMAVVPPLPPQAKLFCICSCLDLDIEFKKTVKTQYSSEIMF